MHLKTNKAQEDQSKSLVKIPRYFYFKTFIFTKILLSFNLEFRGNEIEPSGAIALGKAICFCLNLSSLSLNLL